MEFTGRSGGNHPATWGQAALWQMIEEQRPDDFYQLPHILPVTARRTVDDVLDCLSRLVSRHQSLRTTFSNDQHGGLRQMIHSEGSIPVHLQEVSDEAREQEEATSLVDGFMSSDPMLDRYFAPRFGVVSRDGLAKYLVIVCSHVVLDGRSERVLRAELETLLAATPAKRADVLLPVVHQPDEQARVEALTRSRRISQRSVAYWKTTLASAPSPLLPDADGDGRAPMWCGSLASEAIAEAEAELVGSAGLPSSALYLSATALAVRELLGQAAMTFRIPVSNRFDKALDRYVGNLAQSTMVIVDTTTESFYDLVQRVDRDLMRAYFHARYDPGEMAEAVAEITSRRATPVDLWCLFNDTRSSATKRPDGRAKGSLRLPRAVAGGSASEVSWHLLHPSSGELKLNVRITEADRRPRLDIAANTSYLSRTTIEDALFAVERLVVKAARGDFRPEIGS